MRPPPAALRLLLALWLLAAAGTAAAVQRALLVGVSELPYQSAALWLQAPRNDVLLMRDTLQRQGFAPADITVLADGVAGAALPESQAIQQALQRLLAQSASGDFVLLYFSGHGTRLRDPAKRYLEPDGLAENFLARDVRGVVGTAGASGQLAGSVRDVDVDAWVQAFLARNVFVWAVFDTCSAASMTRSLRAPPPVAEGGEDDEVRWRGVRADQLAAGAAPAEAAPAAVPPPSPATPRARYVAFFASESHQVTPELRLPRDSRGGRPQGLLTWAVAETLQRRPASWRQLYNGVLSLYAPVIAELEGRFPERELPSPVAEGHLDAPLFANPAGPLSTQPAWPAQRAGERLSADAGALDGLEAQQPVRVSAVLADGTVREAEARLDAVATGSAQLAVPPALRDVPGSALWSLAPLQPPRGALLRVRADRPLPPGISLAWPVAVQAAAEGEADLRLVETGRGGGRLEPLQPGLLPPGGATAGDAAALRRRIELLAQLKWFSQLAQLGQDSRIEGFEALLETWEGERLLRSDPLPLAASWAPPGPGQRLALLVRNASGQSIDLVVLSVDAEGALHSLYPEQAGAANRFERGTPQAPALKRFALPQAAAGAPQGGRLLLVASPASPHSAPRLFGLQASEPMADLRVRGQPRPEKEHPLLAASVRWGAAGR
ncbi:caspase family protein [Xenophilus sp.]|uniref:caspase family protein n=1 Tax=Xenophilus sp. TaxID=1873499 RepID=UPI0037DD7091